MTILAITAGIVLLISTYFVQPFSFLKSDFRSSVNEVIARTQITSDEFTIGDMAGLPAPVQKYFIHCGFIGTRKMSYMKATYKDVDFSTGVNKPTIKIDYVQYNFVKEPIRFAFIDSSMYCIPFQGFDSYMDGKGSMKGVIAKTFTLFDQRDADMDKACLVTALSECLIVPDAALQDYITWEVVDETHAKATISYYGINASGIFTFTENGEMLSFTTDDRMAVDFAGNKKRVRWSALCDDYLTDSGIKHPSTLKAVWHYTEGDHKYFDGRNVRIEYK